MHRKGGTIQGMEVINILVRGNKMKKRILIISIFLACLIVPSVLVIAKNTTGGENIAIFTSFKMEILNEGKLTENKMLVDLRIVNIDGDNNISVVWKHVYINPVHETKRVILKAQHFSTVSGSIYNVIVNNNNFSFVIDLSGTSFGTGRTVQVVGNKRSGLITEYDIEATALWWSDILKKKIKTEWRSTDKKIVLPYKEVF